MNDCEVEDLAEPIERYSEGLYYHVCIGDVVDPLERLHRAYGVDSATGLPPRLDGL